MENSILDAINPNELNTWFKTVATKEEAKDLVELLDHNEIYCRVSSGGNLDTAMEGDTFAHQFELFVSEDDLERAKELCHNLALDSLNDIQPDYYLFSYSNEELQRILIEKDEWNELDVLLSEKILKERGFVIDKIQLHQQQEAYENELAEPKEASQAGIVFGYFLAILGGLIGIIIGYSIWKAKRKLPNGVQVFSYTERSRKHGLNIFTIGIVSIVLYNVIRFLIRANML